METARRVVVATGASGGIGRPSAVAFGRQGDPVALLARGEAGLAGAAAEVEAGGTKALPIQVDVADPHELDAAAERVEHELRRKLIACQHHGFIAAGLGAALTANAGTVAALSGKDAR